MKAALLHEAATPLTVEEIDIIDPRPNEVLVKTAVSGVCHSDLHFASGNWNPRMLGRGRGCWATRRRGRWRRWGIR